MTHARSDDEVMTVEEEDGDGTSRFQCPFCNSYDVARLFVASLRMDSCECSSCGARWDEVVGSGEYKGRSTRSSVLLPRKHST